MVTLICLFPAAAADDDGDDNVDDEPRLHALLLLMTMLMIVVTLAVITLMLDGDDRIVLFVTLISLYEAYWHRGIAAVLREHEGYFSSSQFP